VPVFYLRDKDEVTDITGDPTVHPSGFQWGDDEREGDDRKSGDRREQSEPDHSAGFEFRAPEAENVEPAGLEWGSSKKDSDPEEPSRPSSHRPWYLAWFVDQDAQGFRWKSPGD